MDIVEYAIRFRDMASGPLGRLNAGMRESIALSGRMGRAGREAGGALAGGAEKVFLWEWKF